jgi:hypothetical protein
VSTAIRSAEGQATYEKSLHPAWDRGWNGSANIGLAVARGNSDTTDLKTGLNLDRKTLDDEIKMYESSVYATNGLPGGGVTANAILGSVRYDHNITEKLFAFGAADFTHNELQELDIRGIYTGGLGWHVIDKPNVTTFNVLAGINYTRESYSGTAIRSGSEVSRNLPGITVGEDFMHKLGAATHADCKCVFLSGFERPQSVSILARCEPGDKNQQMVWLGGEFERPLRDQSSDRWDQVE